MLAVLGVLAASITFLVRRSRARSSQKRRHDEALIAALPEEYRPRFEDKWLWIGAYLAASAAVGAARGSLSESATLAVACATMLPLTAVLAHKLYVRNRKIMESVRARAGQMDYRQLALLVGRLEEVYGPKMKPLRSLLPTSPGSALRPDEPS